MTQEGPVNLELDPARSECLAEGCHRPQCMSPVRVAFVRFQEARVHRRADGRGVAELVGYESSQLPQDVGSQLFTEERATADARGCRFWSEGAQQPHSLVMTRRSTKTVSRGTR
jgi:hypothetical protein